MVKLTGNTPNTRRKSIAGAEGAPLTPSKPKPNEGVKTPAKANNQTPAKGNKTPKKTPKASPQKQQNGASPHAEPVANGKANKRKSEVQPTTPAKLQKFSGTAEINTAIKEQKEKGKKVKKDKSDVKRPRNRLYRGLKERVVQDKDTSIKRIHEKIEAINARPDLSKSAKKKLKMLKALLKVCGVQVETKKVVVVTKAQKKAQPVKAKQQKKPVKEEPKEEAEVSEEEDSDDDVEGESGDEDIEEESGDEGEEDSDEDEEAVAPPKQQKGKKAVAPPTPKGKAPVKEGQDKTPKGQSRYVLFVGNLPYDAKKQDISDHFQKAGTIRDVRIPSDPQTNKPRGFAYIELENEEAYQKALSMHNTFINGRKINVLYTQSGKNKTPDQKNDMKAKNFKLQAMRKQGQLAGSVKESQKRSARRAKKTAADS